MARTGWRTERVSGLEIEMACIKAFCDGPLNCYGLGHCRHLDQLAWDLAHNTIGRARDCKSPSIGMCSHCGRQDCQKFGDEQCQEARKRFFDEMQKTLAERFKRVNG